MNSIIQIDNLKKHFGLTKAVDGVSFEVKKGESFGFLGPNGAGKTTTIRCMMDFIRPSSGQITLFGLDAHKNSVKLKQKIGYLSGNVKLYSKWTGHEHIKFVQDIRGKSKIVDELIQKLNYDPSIKFGSLSSGNKQKLGLILALMNNPQLLVMDEPTVGLDPLLQNTIYQIISELKAAGTTVLISSHNLPEVEKVCDRAGIIKQGKMVATEDINELGQKRLHKIEVRFASKVNKSDFETKDIEDIKEIKDGLIFTVGKNIDDVIKNIAKHNITDIEVTHATLEDVFMKFYEKDK
ncbi:MAG: ABC transporter ATP-binding protein [Candidatus Saccharibacteria bacterium]